MNESGSSLPAESLKWQRRSFLAAVAVAVVLGGWFAWGLRPPEPLPHLALDTTINPNTAPAASLMRLSGIGPARAEAIVWLRESVAAVGGEPPFDSARDLQRVRGIGPKTSERVSGSLAFDEEGL